MTEHSFQMTYDERETLKRFADAGECLADALTMIAHWMRQSAAVSLSEYAAHWAAAEQRRDVEAMRQFWPLSTPRMIADNCSEWGSYEHGAGSSTPLEIRVGELLLKSRANWRDFVSAVERPVEWADYFAGLEPDADLSQWRLDLERGIAYGPDGQILIS